VGVLARHRIDGYDFPFSDMVLYLLDEPVTNIDPIAFNRQASLPMPGTSVKAIGYGLTSSGGSAPSVLLEVNFEAVAELVCDEAFSGIQPSASELICVYTSGKGICQGDSGGPLVTTVDGELTLLGVTSFGGANACGASPSGFIATSHHQTSFIDKVSCAFRLMDHFSKQLVRIAHNSNLSNRTFQKRSSASNSGWIAANTLGRKVDVETSCWAFFAQLSSSGT
jgi:secreted trypsin-like serine protease